MKNNNNRKKQNLRDMRPVFKVKPKHDQEGKHIRQLSKHAETILTCV